MLFYVFVAFVGFNNNNISYAKYWIWNWSHQTDTPIQQKMTISNDTDPEYRIGVPLIADLES